MWKKFSRPSTPSDSQLQIKNRSEHFKIMAQQLLGSGEEDASWMPFTT